MSVHCQFLLCPLWDELWGWDAPFCSIFTTPGVKQLTPVAQLREDVGKIAQKRPNNFPWSPLMPNLKSLLCPALAVRGIWKGTAYTAHTCIHNSINRLQLSWSGDAKLKKMSKNKMIFKLILYCNLVNLSKIYLFEFFCMNHKSPCLLSTITFLNSRDHLRLLLRQNLHKNWTERAFSHHFCWLLLGVMCN